MKPMNRAIFSVVLVRRPTGWRPDTLAADPPAALIEGVLLSYVDRSAAKTEARKFNQAQQANGRKLWAVVRRQLVGQALLRAMEGGAA